MFAQPSFRRGLAFLSSWLGLGIVLLSFVGGLQKVAFPCVCVCDCLSICLSGMGESIY